MHLDGRAIDDHGETAKNHARDHLGAQLGLGGRGGGGGVERRSSGRLRFLAAFASRNLTGGSSCCRRS